jgi:hypothetical protein
MSAEATHISDALETANSDRSNAAAMPRWTLAAMCIAVSLLAALALEIGMAAHARLMTGDQTYRYMAHAIRFIEEPFFPPLKDYPLPTVLLGGIYRFFFRHDPLAIHWTSVALLAVSRFVTVAGLALFLHRLFRRAWIAPMVVAGFYLYAPYYTIYMFPTNWMVAACFAWTAFFLARFWQTMRAGPGLLAGMTLSLAVLTRFECILILPGVVIISLLAAWIHRRKPAWRLAAATLIILLPAALLIGGYWLAGTLFFDMQPGGGGLNPAYTFIARHQAIFGDVNRNLGYADLIRENPTEFRRAVWANIADFVTRFLLRRINLPLTLLAGLGLVLSLRDRKLFLPLAWLCLYAPFAVYLLTQFDGRYLFAWSLSMLFFAFYALAWGFTRPPTRAHRKLVTTLAAGYALALVLFYAPLSARNSRHDIVCSDPLKQIVLYLNADPARQTLVFGLQSPGRSFAAASYLEAKGVDMYLLDNHGSYYPPLGQLLARADAGEPLRVIAHASQLRAFEEALGQPLPGPDYISGDYSVYTVSIPAASNSDDALVPGTGSTEAGHLPTPPPGP